MNGSNGDPFLRVHDIARLMRRHRSTLYADAKRGLWPPMVKMGGAYAGMFQSELTRMQALLAVNAPREEVRKLVRAIVAERQARAQEVRAMLDRGNNDE